MDNDRFAAKVCVQILSGVSDRPAGRIVAIATTDDRSRKRQRDIVKYRIGSR